MPPVILCACCGRWPPSYPFTLYCSDCWAGWRRFWTVLHYKSTPRRRRARPKAREDLSNDCS